MTAATRPEAAALARTHTNDMVRFLRDLIAVPSESGDEQAVVQRIAAEMAQVGSTRSGSTASATCSGVSAPALW